MLALLHISNIALINELKVEFEAGLNLLTGETGSGKSIIVDALGVLIGGRFTSDLLKSGAERGFIEGLFTIESNRQLHSTLESAGISAGEDEASELIIRRELSASGRNKIFMNNQLATQSLLRDIREFLVDIHGQGEHQTLFDARTHLHLLDAFAGSDRLVEESRIRYQRWRELKTEAEALSRNEAERFQLLDTLNFQVAELEQAQLTPGEDERLEEERRRLVNVERLTALCSESYSLIYEDDDAVLARLRQTANRLAELAEYELAFKDYIEGLESSRAVVEDLAFALREFGDKLEFSPSRLAQIEERLVELSRLKRKYGGAIDSALQHLAASQDRLSQLERFDERETELEKGVDTAKHEFIAIATKLHAERTKAGRRFERKVEEAMAEVALDDARFQVQIEVAPSEEGHFTPTGLDTIQFYFSANPGEDLKPLARVASGGEASRLMLVLKTIANASEFPRTIVFDEIDTGIGGRVSEAVGAKLKKLSQTNQVLCVTHQAQIARFADNHLVVTKQARAGRTSVDVARLEQRGRVEELARMLTGSEITENARRHARELLKS